MTSDDVRLAMAGDRQAFGRLVHAAHPAVAAITLAVTRDPEASADATQDVFLAAWLGLPRLRNPDSFVPWLRQLARHVARSALRTHARHARRQLTGEAAEALLERIADPDAGVDAALLDDERRAALAAALGTLPDDTRDCVILYYREGQSSERVARLLGLSSASVRKRLERARRRLRADLIARLGEELQRTAPPPGAAAAVVAALGSTPRDGHAATVAAAAAAGAGVPMAAMGGAAFGLGLEVARFTRVARRLARPRAQVRAFLGVTVAAVVVLGAVLPLRLPHLLWLWFALTQVGMAFVTLWWLPRCGVPASRRDVVRWLASAALGTVAVAWALRQMGAG